MNTPVHCSLASRWLPQCEYSSMRPGFVRKQSLFRSLDCPGFENNTHKNPVLSCFSAQVHMDLTLRTTFHIAEPLGCHRQHSTSNHWSIHMLERLDISCCPLVQSPVERNRNYITKCSSFSMWGHLYHGEPQQPAHTYINHPVAFNILRVHILFVLADGKGMCIINARGVSWGGRSW